MKIKELPVDIRDIALKRVNEAGDNYRSNLPKNIQEVHLTCAFEWDSTPECKGIWSDVNNKKYQSFRDFHKKPPTTPQPPHKQPTSIK